MFAHKNDLPGVSRAVLSLTFAGAITGCAPLQQAPLVYTSSHVVGVKLGVAPTQPESLEAVIGYKDLDAAYAPVAVSSPYLGEAIKPGNKYDKELYGIKEIYGIYGTQASATGASQLLTAAESENMQTYFNDFSVKEKNLEVDNGNKKIWDDAVSLKSLADQLQKEPRGNNCLEFNSDISLKINYKTLYECSSEDAQREIIRKYAKLSVEDKKYSTVIKDEADAKGAYDASHAAYQIALNNFSMTNEKVKEILEKLASIQKRDAISVYGSFDTDTGAETKNPMDTGKNGVRVKVGKVFSTGVAAQNISEAQKIGASAVVVSACINALSEHAEKTYSRENAEKKQEFIKALMPECFKSNKDK